MERTAQEAGEHQNGPGLRDRRQAEDAAAATGTGTAATAAEYRKPGAGGRAAATRRTGTRRTDRRRRRRGARVARADRQVGRAEKTVRPTVADGSRPGAGVVRGHQGSGQAQQRLRHAQTPATATGASRRRRRQSATVAAAAAAAAAAASAPVVVVVVHFRQTDEPQAQGDFAERAPAVAGPPGQPPRIDPIVRRPRQSEENPWLTSLPPPPPPSPPSQNRV